MQLLDTIDSPADLRRLNYEQLDRLASEIRTFIVEAVSATGGHLGSNLGAVELTLALHRVFDSPRDIVLWDTGHQAYVHKLLTGRRAGFVDLRQQGGMSGYPCRAESPHDWIENSHASTSLSYAHGIAVAQDSPVVGEGRRVVAVIGDGSMTGGMAYEALNNLGHTNTPAVIVLNDNGRSYAPTVGKLTESVARLRLNPSYLRSRERLRQRVRELPLVGDRLAWGLNGAVAGLRELVEPHVFFETLGVRYSGPFDGHDIEGLERALRGAASYDGPVVVHVLTTKGKGYPPAEGDEEMRLHDTSVFDPELGPQPMQGGAPKYTNAFSEVMLKEADLHPELVAITAAMPGSTGLLPFAERYPNRFFDVGIAEQHAVTAAAGMAMGGLRPVVAIYSTFLTRAFDQTMYDVGLHGEPVVFAIDRAGITGPNGPSHHGVLDLALLSRVPGMTLLAPSSYQELQQMFHDAFEMSGGPIAIRWPGTTARMVGEHEIGHGLAARRAVALADHAEPELCLIGVGPLLEACEQVAARLAADGIGVTVWDPRAVKPLDPELITDAARHRLVVTVEDGIAVGGVGATVADQVSAAALAAGADRPPYVRTLGIPDHYIPQGKPEAILSSLGLDADGIEATARQLLHR
jgi:1-deoxy-D-xylulose-5-phosphate synthase